MAIHSKENRKRSGIDYVIEAAAGIAFVYFFLGGNQWSATLWAVFTVLSIWIVVMNIRRDAGLESEAAYDRWRLHFGFILVVALLLGAVWQTSPWLLGLTVILGLFWISDWRSHRSTSKTGELDVDHLISDDHHR